MIYLQLFWEFFKTGLFAVGGGLAADLAPGALPGVLSAGRTGGGDPPGIGTPRRDIETTGVILWQS